MVVNLGKQIYLGDGYHHGELCHKILIKGVRKKDKTRYQKIIYIPVDKNIPTRKIKSS